MPSVYSYIRFSTPEQARGDSLRRQLADAEEWCRERGLVLDQTVRDLGVSAYKGSNVEVGSGLGNFLELVKAGKIEKGSTLIVESLDRLSRENVLVALPRFLDLLNAGIRIVTLTDKQEYEAGAIKQQWNPLIVSLAVMARAHDESQVKSIRVSKAWAKKRAKAREEGHKMTRRAPEWLNLENGKFVQREDRVEIVRRVFHETIAGDGRRTIASRLNLEGRPAFKGKNGWHTSAIAKILANKAVFGEFQPGTGSHASRNHRPEGAPIKDYYPVIVDEAIYWEAQRVVALRRSERDENGVTIRRGKGGRRGHGVAHLLIGLGKCTHCGGAMHLINKGQPPKGALYFECSTARRKAGCDNNTRWRVDAIERRLLKHLAYIDADVVLRGEAPSGEAEKVQALKARLDDVERRRDAVLRVVATGDEAATKMFEGLAAEVKEVSAKLSEAEKSLSLASADPGLKVRLAEAVDLTHAMSEAEGEERVMIRTRLAEQLHQLVEKILFDPEIGVTAILRARPDIPADQIPFVYGTGKTAPWLLSLDEDSQPHGPEPWQGQDDEPSVPIRQALPFLARKIAKR